jgi:hypothetical protein
MTAAHRTRWLRFGVSAAVLEAVQNKFADDSFVSFFRRYNARPLHCSNSIVFTFFGRVSS